MKSAKIYITLLFSCYLLIVSWDGKQVYPKEPKKFQNITLETSLKPFKQKDPAYIAEVATHMFEQWSNLLVHTDTVSVMLWIADGSEILEYTGDMQQPLEWAKYIGNPNTSYPVGSGPKSLSLHERAYLYMDNPPDFSYADLSLIIETLREKGTEITGKKIKIGATFDPGPEFARSEFKYVRHPEILEGNAMGHKSFVSCYALLNGDNVAYAAYPNGIPDQTPFGTFFGKQSQLFLTDLNFDFLWLSNGFGFGVEPWSSTGAVFTGAGFLQHKLEHTRQKIINFWTLFRKECAGFEIQTRGSNLSTGVDLARDGVDLRSIYKSGFNIMPPPNSPWAAIDGDFGLEMVGYMSHIAELPDDRYVYRFYTHDPWWLNSPWLDRYGRFPHDIYMPMSVARIDEKGQVALPSTLNFLTIDDSFGNIPDVVPNEVIPHILRGREDSPTAAGPVVWVYPFDEYHDWAKERHDLLPEMYYGDWFIRQAINEGLPLNTVTSTTNFTKLLKSDPSYYLESIVLTIVPDAGSAQETALSEFIKKGGQAIVYGPADRASTGFRELLNLKNIEPLEGELELVSQLEPDVVNGHMPTKIQHNSLFSGGGLRTMIADKHDQHTKRIAYVIQGKMQRDQAWIRSLPSWKGGKVAYIRGTNSSSFQGGMLLRPDDPEQWAISPKLVRHLLAEFDYRLSYEKEGVSVKSPMLTIARSHNGFFFSGYAPNTTVLQKFKFPQGAPILHGYDTKLERGMSTYHFPTAWHNEVRVFVEQHDGIVSSKEMHSGELGVSRRIRIAGLKNATLRIYPEDHVTVDSFKAYLNVGYPWKTGQQTFEKGDPKYGHHFVIRNVTGHVTVAW
ncbi:hypothetical protein [Sphingobacterium olei]|nr:hypothetical protein [Sphingobacterium olei]